MHTKPLVSLILIAMILMPSFSMFDVASGQVIGSQGLVETLDSATAGTHGVYGSLDITGNARTDAVILGGALWLMFTNNDSSMVCSYSPKTNANAWNISMDAYTPRIGASYCAAHQTPGLYGIRMMLKDVNGVNITGVELLAGTRDKEGIYVYTPANGWTRAVAGLLPAIIDSSTDSGNMPRHYTISFARISDSQVRITVRHTTAGLLTQLTVNTGGSVVRPGVDVYSDVSMAWIKTQAGMVYPMGGGWMMDNFMIRSSGTRWFQTYPDYETVNLNGAMWISVRDENGRPISDAQVSLGGSIAIYDASTERYQAVTNTSSLKWSVPTTYNVSVDGVQCAGTIKLTTAYSSDLVSVTKWWNGWDWVSVFGRDDCYGPQTALNTYKGYDHPITAYIFTDNPTGNSSSILSSQSEIAKHGPHDYWNWMKKSWSDSVASANQGQQALIKAYAYASRWDNPAYVGKGETYISLANPGDSATYQMMYAQYQVGIRIEGTGSSSCNGVSGNASLIGCWWLTPYQKWNPTSPIDLMDACRQYCTDSKSITYSSLMDLARRGGVARFYNHGVIAQPDILHWVTNVKTNFTLENWKATDGEVASYLYGRMTTLAMVTHGDGNSNLMEISVNRSDPIKAGYWLVPVTIAIPLNNRTFQDVEIVGKDRTLSSLNSGSDSIRNLASARVMDVGYDVRNGTLYVSGFWNDSSLVVVHFKQKDPVIVNKPVVSVMMGANYSFKAARPDSTVGTNWSLNTNASFLSIAWSDNGYCLISGQASIAGKYYVSLGVTTAEGTRYVNWTLNCWQGPDEPPNTIIVGAPTGWTNRPVRLTYNATDDKSGVNMTYYSLDSGNWTEWTTDILIQTVGVHNIRYYSVDFAGNSESVKNATVAIDTTIPVIVMETKDGAVFYGEITLRFKVYANVSGLSSLTLVDEFGYKLQLPLDSSSIEVSNSTVGVHQYTIMATDKAGNIESYQVKVDLKAGGDMSIWSYQNLALLGVGVTALILSVVVWRRRKKN